MKRGRQNIGFKLKLGVVAVSLVMPMVGALTGLYYGFFIAETDYPLLWPLVFAMFGVALDAICINGKVFSFFFYKLPIPTLLSIMAYEASSFFTTRLVSVCFGIGGLALGILIDFVLIAPKPFYLARKRVLIVVYVLMSMLLLGVMLGVPISNFILGILAGNYYSLRYSGAVLSKERLRHNLRSVTAFATLVLLVSEVPFGWLIWQDKANVLDYLFQVTGMTFSTGHLLLSIIGFGTLAVAVQFMLAYMTAKIMYRYRVCSNNVA